VWVTAKTTAAEITAKTTTRIIEDEPSFLGNALGL
jgi:hypothetical protein